MIIRNFTQQDEEAVVHLWNRCCIKDTISLRKFRKQALYDDNFDESLTWVVMEEDLCLGFVMAMKRKFPYMERGLELEKGWISVLFIAPEVRRQGLGSLLLKKAENELIDRGTKKIILGAYSPGYFFPGIDEKSYPEAKEFFTRHGYLSKELHYSMGMDLNEYQMPQKIVEKKNEKERKGYQFVKFNEVYSLELLKFLRDEFGGGWKRNAWIAMRNDTAVKTIQLVLSPDGKICGCCMRAIDENPERFGPIGIAESVRNEKLGSVLLHQMCSSMKESGCQKMFFMTTDEAGKRYYERNGLNLLRMYRSYEKEI